MAGSAWQNTKYSPTEQSEAAQDILALLVNSSLRVVTFSKTNLDVTVSALPALSDPGRFFFNTNATFYVKLWSNLKYNLSLYGTWTPGRRRAIRQRLRLQFRAGLELRQPGSRSSRRKLPCDCLRPGRRRDHPHCSPGHDMSLICGPFARGAIGLARPPPPAPLHAGEKTDVLYMKNGDRMTCEIKSLNAGSLQIRLDYVEGTISVQWSRVQRLDSKRLFS